MSYLIVGMTSPNSIEITIDNSEMTAAGEEVDLSIYSYCRFLVRKPTATEDVIWEADITDSTPTRLTVSHTFDHGDLNEAGCYILKPRLSITPFYALITNEVFVTLKVELNPIGVRYCSNVDLPVEGS